ARHAFGPRLRVGRSRQRPIAAKRRKGLHMQPTRTRQDRAMLLNFGRSAGRPRASTRLPANANDNRPSWPHLPVVRELTRVEVQRASELNAQLALRSFMRSVQTLHQRGADDYAECEG